MAPTALSQIPNFAEFLGSFETILDPENPSNLLKAHYKSSDDLTIKYFKADYVEGVPTIGVNLNNVR
jgi:hypothetical protein